MSHKRVSKQIRRLTGGWGGEMTRCRVSCWQSCATRYSEECSRRWTDTDTPSDRRLFPHTCTPPPPPVHHSATPAPQTSARHWLTDWLAVATTANKRRLVVIAHRYSLADIDTCFLIPCPQLKRYNMKKLWWNVMIVRCLNFIVIISCVPHMLLQAIHVLFAAASVHVCMCDKLRWQHTCLYDIEYHTSHCHSSADSS